MKENFATLTTEQRNPNTANIDKCSTLEILRLINEEDKKVALAVEKVLPEISRAVDLITEKISAGGRLFYLGAGTSGRLGVLDASECPPTFSVAPELVQGIIAGGEIALTTAVEGAEDDRTLAEKNLREKNFSAKDILVGLSTQKKLML